MTLLHYPHGGAVSAVGSITWCACMSYNDYTNTVSAITRNVLEGFLRQDLPERNGPRQTPRYV